MELKHLISHFVYRIEPRPEGGFIARATDPSVPPIEATTREELQQKIQAAIAANLAAAFPGLQLPVNNQQLKFAFHIEHKPGGGFVIQSSDPNARPIEGATHAEIENHFLEKLIGFAGKHFMPELARAMTAQGNAANIKVLMNGRGGFTVSAGAKAASFGSPQTLPASNSNQGFRGDMSANIEDGKSATSIGSPTFGNVAGGLSNSPILPESSKGWTIALIMLVSMILALLMYFLLYRR